MRCGLNQHKEAEMPGKKEYLYIFTADIPVRSSAGSGRRGVHDVVEKIRGSGVKTALSTIQNNMCGFLESLDKIIAASPQDVGGLALDEIEVHAQIDGKGNVGIAGLLSAEVATQGGIKFVLRKKR